MKIKKLEIDNFRGFRQATVDFPESNLAVFIGVNGQGKSSILDLVGIFLTDFLKDLGYKKLSLGSLLRPTDIKAGRFESFNKATLISAEVGNFTKIKSQEIQLESNIQISDTLLSIGWPRERNTYRNKFIELLKVEGNAIDFPILAYYIDTRYFEDKHSFDAKKERRRNQYPQFDSYDRAFDKKIQNFNDFFLWYKNEEDLENAEIKRVKDFNYKNPRLEVVRKTILTFFGKLGSDIFTNLRVERPMKDAGYYFDEEDENIAALFISKNDQNLSLSQLSAGEKMLLMMVCDIARRLSIANPSLSDPLQGDGIVLIDEIELHLHPKWQRDVIPALLGTFPNIQFILSTHSPQVLSSVDIEDIFLLKDGEVLKLSSNPKGLDTNTILEEVMDNTPRYPREVDVLIDELFSLIQQRKFDQVEDARRKVAEASPDNPVLQRADAMMERLKILN